MIWFQSKEVTIESIHCRERNCHLSTVCFHIVSMTTRTRYYVRHPTTHSEFVTRHHTRHDYFIMPQPFTIVPSCSSSKLYLSYFLNAWGTNATVQRLYRTTKKHRTIRKTFSWNNKWRLPKARSLPMDVDLDFATLYQYSTCGIRHNCNHLM